ncbi:MarR family winged helix-turn-helix transcriptional regulator [Streptomyces sp. CA-181903]|uniref:MarR family winged helix-turn-helix transcriptional regulator n=1 Tax=Streptomyces sp. CA-181903 TaxID=3240055 RepID=UPI003D89EE85
MSQPEKTLNAQQERLVERLGVYAADYAEYGRRFAGWLGLHTTDGTALVEIINAEHRDDPLTPARLSRRIQLSPAATSALINRLEKAGHVTRTREHTDRRVVTLRTGQEAQRLADEYFSPVAAVIGTFLDRYPTEVLGRFEDFLDGLHRTLADHLADGDRSRQPSASPPAPGIAGRETSQE